MPNDTAPAATQQTAPDAAPPPAAEPTLDELASRLIKTDPEPSAPVEEQTTDEQHTDAPAEAEKPKEPERVSPRIAAALRAEMRAKNARTEVQQLQTQLDARTRELETRAKDLDAREAKLKLLEEDPVRFFEEYKVDPKGFLEKLATEHKPENVIAKKVAKLETDTERLQRERDEAIAREKETRESNERTRIEADANKSFVTFITANADKFTFLTEEFSEDEACAEAWSALTEVVGKDRDGKDINRAQAYYLKFGEYPTEETIAAYVNDVAKARIEKRRAPKPWRKAGESAHVQPREGVPGDPNAAPMVRGSSPRTLTSRGASERGTAQKPWSQESADEESLRILQASLNKAS